MLRNWRASLAWPMSWRPQWLARRDGLGKDELLEGAAFQVPHPPRSQAQPAADLPQRQLLARQPIAEHHDGPLVLLQPPQPQPGEGPLLLVLHRLLGAAVIRHLGQE